MSSDTYKNVFPIIICGVKLNNWLSVGIDFLSNNSAAIYIAAASILLSALVAYWNWFRPPAVRLSEALEGLSKALDKSNSGWANAVDAARGAAKVHSAVHIAWGETETRVIPLTHGQHNVHVMFGAPRDLWSANRMLSRSINLPLAEAVPNLLVGVGLLFTFFFLTLALTQATAALLPQAGNAPGDLTAATRGLLSAAGAKFLTSLAGLLASIVWAIAARRRMASLNSAAERVVESIGRIAPYGGAEMAVFAQVQAAHELNRSSGDQTVYVRDLAIKGGQHLELTEELLNEARDQTGTFKRFETDLAVSLAGAITTAFSPQMQAMTDRLTSAIDGLSEKLGTMNQEALAKMMEDFGNMLKKATDSEMTKLREALEELAAKLTVAGAVVGDGGTKAAVALDKAGSDLLARVEQISANLATGATDLQGATDGVKEAMNGLGHTIDKATNLGREGAEFVRGALGHSDELLSRLKSVSTGMSAASENLAQVGRLLADAVDNVEELTKEQHAVVQSVRDATPQAMKSVQSVLEVLQLTVQVTASSMEKTKDAMESTSKTLGTTVAAITGGVSEYSNTVAKLHLTMDEQLAKAVGSLEKGISGLDESVEELAEVMTARPPRG